MPCAGAASGGSGPAASAGGAGMPAAPQASAQAAGGDLRVAGLAAGAAPVQSFVDTAGLAGRSPAQAQPDQAQGRRLRQVRAAAL